MLSKVRLKFKKRKRLFQGIKLQFWGLNFVEFWCWGFIFGGQGGPGPGPPLDLPLRLWTDWAVMTITPVNSNAIT